MLSAVHFLRLIYVGASIIIVSSFLEIPMRLFTFPVVVVSTNIPKLQLIMDIYTILAMFSPLSTCFLNLFFLFTSIWKTSYWVIFWIFFSVLPMRYQFLTAHLFSLHLLVDFNPSVYVSFLCSLILNTQLKYSFYVSYQNLAQNQIIQDL